MKVHRLWIFVLSAFTAVVIVSSSAICACPLGCCGNPSPIPLAHQLANSNVILLAERVSGDEPAKQTTFVLRHREGDDTEELNFNYPSIKRLCEQDLKTVQQFERFFLVK